MLAGRFWAHPQFVLQRFDQWHHPLLSCQNVEGVGLQTTKDSNTLACILRAKRSYQKMNLFLANLQGKLMELMSKGGNPAPAPTSYRHLLGLPSTEPNNFIVAIDKVTLAQSAASAGSDQQGSRCGGCLAEFGTFEKGTGYVGLFPCLAWPDLRWCALSV